MNAVVAAFQLDALDGSMGDLSSLDIARSERDIGNAFQEGGEKNAPTQPIGDLAACAPTFRILRALVSDWLAHVSDSADPHADSLLVQLYRWLCAEDSLLYDPVMRRVVTSLIRKVSPSSSSPEWMCVVSSVLTCEFMRMSRCSFAW